MENPLRADRGLFLAITVSTLMVIAWAPKLLAADREPLRILLTNDDGFDSPGITAVFDTLVAAGHEVTLVAPLRNQSGSGVRITTRGVLDYKEHSTGIWSVDGSPADSVLVGLTHILKVDEAPDIVISGANFGPNLSYGSSSGTVGAATMAMYWGIPAIAVSVGIDSSERDAVPIPFPSTISAFKGAADLTLELINNLQDARIDTEKLLPEHTILNVNYPAVSPDELKGIRIARAARGGSGIRFDYEETDQTGQLQVRFRFSAPDTEGGNNTDVELFLAGNVTISVLDGDWDAGEPLREAMLPRLKLLRGQ
jgi:5'/3'-nucleotidase SurE